MPCAQLRRAAETALTCFVIAVSKEQLTCVYTSDRAGWWASVSGTVAVSSTCLFFLFFSACWLLRCHYCAASACIARLETVMFSPSIGWRDSIFSSWPVQVTPEPSSSPLPGRYFSRAWLVQGQVCGSGRHFLMLCLLYRWNKWNLEFWINEILIWWKEDEVFSELMAARNCLGTEAATGYMATACVSSCHCEKFFGKARNT